MWLNGLVVSALGIRARVATLGKLLTHIDSPIAQFQETGEQQGSFRRLSGYGD